MPNESLGDETSQYIPSQLQYHICFKSHCEEGHHSSSNTNQLKKKNLHDITRGCNDTC